jgi:site-specific DNA-methyltransferase (adenine-specific)
MTPYFETEKGRLYNGDCIETLETFEDESVDLTIIDPPYSSGARQTNQLRARKGMLRSERFHNDWFGTDNCSTAGFMFFMRGCLIVAYQKAKIGSHLYTFIDWRNYPVLSNVLESSGWRINNLIVWDKEIFGMGQNYRNQHELIVFCSKGNPKDCTRHDLPNVLRSKRVKQENHPTEKPDFLITHFVDMSSNEGDTVLDFFMGSGVVAEVCEKFNRKWIGVEISENYCQDIRTRLQAVSAQYSMLASNNGLHATPGSAAQNSLFN